MKYYLRFFFLDMTLVLKWSRRKKTPPPDPRPNRAPLMCELIGRVPVCLQLLLGRPFLIGCLEPSGSPLKAYTHEGSFIGCEQCWDLLYLTCMWSPWQRGLQLLSAAMAAKSLSLLHCLYFMLVLLLLHGTFFGLTALLLLWGIDWWICYYLYIIIVCWKEKTYMYVSNSTNFFIWRKHLRLNIYIDVRDVWPLFLSCVD